MEKNKYLCLLAVLMLSFCNGCKEDYSRIDFYGESAEDVMLEVEKNKNILDKINAARKEESECSIYAEISGLLQERWASSEIMTRWYKICLKSITSSKEAFNTEENVNDFSCHAFIWFLRTGDRKAIEELPILTSFPVFEQARQKYLHLSPQEFAKWAKDDIIPYLFKKYNDKIPAFYYCRLLASAGIVANDFELAKKANEMSYYIYSEFGTSILLEAASNIAFYADKLGVVPPEDRDILIDYYNRYMKDQRQIRSLKKRKDFILYVLKKYKIVPKISVLPPK